MGKTYRATVCVSESEIEEMRSLLSAGGGDDITFVYPAIFSNCMLADVKCCVTETSAWIEAVLYNKEGQQLCCTEPCDGDILGEWNFKYNNDKYVVEVLMA